MLTMLFAVLMVVIFWKILRWGIKAAWGVTKFLFSVVLLPLFLIGLVVEGLLAIALPILLVVGAVVLFGARA